MRDVRQWLDSLGLGQYADAFEGNAIELDQLVALSDEELKELGVSALGHRKRIKDKARSQRIPDKTSFEQHTPHQLAEHIVASGVAADGERKQVTVLFADLCGSTALIEGLDAEAAVERMQPALHAMREAVHRFEGTVNRIQGDGIMALFGAPVAHEDHALRACLAGLQIRDAIGALGDDALAPRVGLNSGEAVVRSIQNDLTVEYEADGPVVHLAARMEQLAEPGTVRATRDTWRLVDGFIDARPLGTPPVKGVSKPLSQYELIAPYQAATRWEGRARRGLTRFVGREGEMAVIQEAAAEAAAGHGQVVALVGEAGMGKSRLLHEFLQSPGVRQWTVRVAAATPHGKSTPYLPLKQLLRDVIGADSDDNAHVVADKLAAHLRLLDSELEVLLAPLQALLDLEVTDEEWQSLQPPIRRRHIVQAMRELALSRARQRPLLFVFEDLHWIDEETQEVLDRLVESLGSASLLLLVTSRPEYRQPWYGKSYFVPVHVGSIPVSKRAELLDELLGNDASLEALKGEIEARSEGRPLFTEEIVRALADGNAIAGSQGNYRLIQADAQIPIPDTIQAVISARIDRLDPAHKRLLQVASILGRTVAFELLQIVAAIEESECRAGLSALQTAEFLFETRSFPSAEYIFKHALIENVTYDSLLQRQRRAFHEAALRAYEVRYAERIDEYVEHLAHHAMRAELWEEAIRYSRQAGNRAVTKSAYREATEHFEQALAAIAHLPESEETISTAIDIRFELRPALGALGQYRKLLEHLTEARSLADSMGDRHREALIDADMIHVLYHIGEVERALRTGEQAMQEALEVDDRRILIQAASNLAHAHMCKGEFRRAIEIANPFAEDLQTRYRHERLGTTGTSACIWLGNLCGTNAMVGAFERAFEYGEDACRIAQETNLPFDRVMSGTWLAFGLVVKGDTKRSIPLIEECMEIVSEYDLGFFLIWSLVVYVSSYTVAQDPARALLMLEKTADQRGRLQSLVGMSLWLGAAETMALYQSGQHERADTLCSELLASMTKHEMHTFEPVVLRIRGLSIARGPAADHEAGRDLIRRAREVATRQGALPEVAHADLALAMLSADEGDLDNAHTLARSALHAYKRMAMTGWEASAQAVLAVV